MALKDYPNWVLIHKSKGKEIRFINGKYYLYQVHTQRIDGKVKKFTDKYLGRITEEGLIPPTDKHNEYLVKEYGLTAFIFSCCENIIHSIVDRFPSRYKKLIPLAILQYFFHNNLDEYHHHYVSILFPNVVIKEETHSIQNEINRITSMFDHTVSKALSPISLDEFRAQISTLHIVGLKDKWTVALYDEKILNIIDKYKIKLEISYAKNK